ASGQASQQHDQRNPRAMKMQFFGQAFDRERRVGIHSPVAFRVSAPRRPDNRRRSVELGHQAVITRAAAPYDSTPSFTSACGNNVRTSKREIAGRKRTNRNSSATKKPIVPVKTA